MESAASAGDLPQVLAGKAEKRKRPEISLWTLFVNWIGAFSSLPFGKLPERYSNFRHSGEQACSETQVSAVGLAWPIKSVAKAGGGLKLVVYNCRQLS